MKGTYFAARWYLAFCSQLKVNGTLLLLGILLPVLTLALPEVGVLKSIQLTYAQHISQVNFIESPYQHSILKSQVSALSSGMFVPSRVHWHRTYTYGPLKDLQSFILGPDGKAPEFSVYYHRGALNRILNIVRNNGYHTINVYNHQGHLARINFTSGNCLVLAYTYHDNLHHDPVSMTITPGPLLKKAQVGSDAVTYHYAYNARNELTAFWVSSSGSADSGQSFNLALYPHNAFGSAIVGQDFTYGMNHEIHTVRTRFIQRVDQRQHTVIDTSAIVATYHYRVGSGHPNELKFIDYASAPKSQTIYPYLPAIKAMYSQGRSFLYNDLNQVRQDPQRSTYAYNLNNRVIGYASDNALTPSVNVVYGRDAKGLLNYEQSYLTSSSGVRSTINGKAIHLMHLADLGLAQQGQVSTATLPGFVNLVQTSSGTQYLTTKVQDLYAVAQNSIAMTSTWKHARQVIGNIYTYSPYGMQSDALHLINSSQSENYQARQTWRVFNIQHNRAGYTGQNKDSSTGNMMLGWFRLYSPNLGVYLGHDSLNSFSKHSVGNPWAYVKANPMLYTDPTGHMFFGRWQSRAKELLEQQVLSDDAATAAEAAGREQESPRDVVVAGRRGVVVPGEAASSSALGGVRPAQAEDDESEEGDDLFGGPAQVQGGHDPDSSGLLVAYNPGSAARLKMGPKVRPEGRRARDILNANNFAVTEDRDAAPKDAAQLGQAYYEQRPEAVAERAADDAHEARRQAALGISPPDGQGAAQVLGYSHMGGASSSTSDGERCNKKKCIFLTVVAAMLVGAIIVGAKFIPSDVQYPSETPIPGNSTDVPRPPGLFAV